VLEMNIERAKAIDLRIGKPACDLRLTFHILNERPLAFPGFHGGTLHCFIRILALHSRSRKRE